MPPDCAPTSAPHVQVIYARASDAPDRFETMAPKVRKLVELATGAIDREARLFEHEGRIRVACKDGQADVANVVLAVTAENATFRRIKDDLAAVGYGRAGVKYWVWYDGRSIEGVAGLGDFRQDHRLAPDNENVIERGYAVTFGIESWIVMLHELAHTMGAVQRSSPNATAYGHCLDGQDIMCYDDRFLDPRTTRDLMPYNPAACIDYEHFDCNHDDYFHPEPPPGSYLATHWNLAHPYNVYLRVTRASSIEDSGKLGANPKPLVQVGET
ncbi:MAG TPA: hypothetical protein VM681_03770 [Candidatus Thermoplasmatota archaeon]|nr:hypothetical protein [Candidatus Thermoplasmatota archaeon]